MGLTLVTGGAGFVGRHVVEALLERGDTVRVLDVAPPAAPHAGAAFHRGSILDAGAVEAAAAGVDCLYHIAGIAHLWVADREDFDRVNRQGTETVMAAAARAGVRRVVHCSTESILLPKRRNGAAVDESAPPPLEDMPGPYTRSKHLGEQAALRACGEGLDVVVVNPTIPVGPGDRNMTPPAAMLSLFLSGGSPFFLDCVLNLVDVRDLAAGILRAEAAGRRGERYILGGENVALRDLLPLIGRLSGKPMPKRTVPKAMALAAGTVSGFIADRLTRKAPKVTREGVVLALRSAPFDSGKARRELGYAPAGIERAIAETVAELTRGKVNARRTRQGAPSVF